MSNHQDWKHTAVHAAHFALQTEAGKRTAQTAVTTLASAAAPALIVASIVAMPVTIVGLAAWGLWRVFKK